MRSPLLFVRCVGPARRSPRRWIYLPSLPQVASTASHAIKTVILPQANMQHLHEIQEEVRRDMTFVPAETLEQVLKVAFEDPLVNSSAVTK